MKRKFVFGFHFETGIFTGSVECQANPLEWGKFIIPANAVDVEPPKAPEGSAAFWTGKKWKIQKLLAK